MAEWKCEKVLECPTCGKSFASKSNLKLHALIHSGQRFDCLQCDRTFTQKCNVKRHVQVVHASSDPGQQASLEVKGFVCDLCQRAFAQKNNMIRHRKTHDRIPSSSKKLVVVRKKKSDVKKEELLADELFECEMCLKVLSSGPKLRRHVEAAHRRPLSFSCDFCPKAFTSGSHLAYHRRVHTDERPYACPLCPGRRFRWLSSWRQHAKTHDSEQQQHVCPVCERTFAHVSALRTHSRQHTGKRPYVCKHCPRDFVCVGGLRIHERTHSGDRPYRCHHCAMLFIDKSNLNRHLKKKHPAGLACAICLESFDSQALLDEHGRWHRGELPYLCRDCPRAFEELQALRAHTAKAHLDTIFYKCLVCDEAFPTRIKLEIHGAVHEASFECYVCSRTFTTKALLQAHLKIHTEQFVHRHSYLTDECPHVASDSNETLEDSGEDDTT